MDGLTQIANVLADHCPRRIGVGGRTRAAVLIPLLEPEKDRELAVLFVRRTTQPGDPHSAQVAFPGGKVDDSDASLFETSLREAYEEVGLIKDHVTMLGELDEIVSVTDFVVRPFVAQVSPLHPLWKTDPKEIDYCFEVPWSFIVEDANWKEMPWKAPDGKTYPVDILDWQGEVIWGLTARILKQFLRLL